MDSKLLKALDFLSKPDSNAKNILIGTYQDIDNFGARFQIYLSDDTNESLNWASDQLNQKYRNSLKF